MGEKGFCQLINGRLVYVVGHSPSGETHILADSVSVADTALSRTFGLMGKKPLRAGEALVFPFGERSKRTVHTWFVRGSVDILWIVHEHVTATETMEPWSSRRGIVADTIIELPAGGATAVEPGWIVTLSPTLSD